MTIHTWREDGWYVVQVAGLIERFLTAKQASKWLMDVTK